MRLSASQLKTWATCALQGKFKYVDEINRYRTGSSAMLGSAAHLGFETLLEGYSLDEALTAFTKYYDDPENTPDYLNRRTTFAGLRTRGLDMVTDFASWLEENNHDIQTIGTEIPFKVPFGDHVLSGFIDWLYFRPSDGRLAVVDHKTGVRPNGDKLRHDPQFTVYAWAVKQKEFWVGYTDPETGEVIGGFENGEELFKQFSSIDHVYIWFDHKNCTTYSVGPREEQDFMRLYRLVEQVQRAIDTETFVPHLSGDNCGFCFAGETRFLTREGWKTFNETVGTIQKIRGINGAWLDAPVRNYGKSNLMKVTLSKGRARKEIFATPNHRWFVDNHKALEGSIFETAQLKEGMKLLSLYGSGINKSNPMLGGIQAGLVYGDGHKVRGGQNGSGICLFTEKNIKLLRFFPGLPIREKRGEGENIDFVIVSGMPSYYKDAPPITESPSYLKGWLMGYFAADGTITEAGQCSISSASRESLLIVQDVCGIIGLGTSDIHMAMRVGTGVEETPLYKIYLHGYMLNEDFFLVNSHKEKFNNKNNWRPIRNWTVVSVEETDRYEDVFCVDVPDSDRFVIEGNILTHNCDYHDLCPVFIPESVDFDGSSVVESAVEIR